MANFQYIAINRAGKSVKSTIEADNQAAAVVTLRKQGQRVLSLQPAKNSGILNFKIGGTKVKTKPLVIFTRQLSTLVNAGVPLVRSLNTLQVQTESKALKVQLADVVKKVEGGTSLADALAAHPKTFSPIYINMVRAGEEGGILDEVLKRLAIQQEKDSAIRGKIKGAMTYPAVIFSITIVASIVLMTTIVPKIAVIITDLSGGTGSLPIYTKVLLAISDFMLTPSVIISAVIALPTALISFRRFIKTPKGRYWWHSVLLKVPIIKVLLTKVAIARFARTFSSLMGSGVTIVQAINTTAGAVGNAVIEKELTDSAKFIESGEQLSTRLEQSKHFPPLVSQMLAVGEETGQTDQILIKVAEFYEEEVDTFVGALASILEPLMIVVLGAIVGVIAVSVIGPISSLSTSIK